jgi:hypothetical protein
MRVGYVRVSTVDQNTVRQLDGVDVERVFTDHASGKDTSRPEAAGGQLSGLAIRCAHGGQGCVVATLAASR